MTTRPPGPPPPAHNVERHPRSSPFHDVLLIRKQFVPGQRDLRFERFAIDKTTGSYINENAGQKAPVRPDAEGYRPTMNLGTTGAGTPEDPRRGPALSTLPLHPSPAASSSTSCYLINPENFNYHTPWTAEEWNDSPGGFDAPGRVGEDRFSLLVASPSGKVYYLEKKLRPGAQRPAVNHDDQDFTFREIELRGETEIWAQLRSGCVAGRAIYEGAPGARHRSEKVVPLVNIDSLSPRAVDLTKPDTHGEQERAK
jgi:hypothetical protein